MKAEYIIIVTINPMPCSVNPPTIMPKAFSVGNRELKIAACGPIISKG